MIKAAWEILKYLIFLTGILSWVIYIKEEVLGIGKEE